MWKWQEAPERVFTSSQVPHRPPGALHLDCTFVTSLCNMSCIYLCVPTKTGTHGDQDHIVSSLCPLVSGALPSNAKRITKYVLNLECNEYISWLALFQEDLTTVFVKTLFFPDYKMFSL